MTIAFLLSAFLLLWIDPQGSALGGQTLGTPIYQYGALLFLLVRCQNPAFSGIIAA
jgi:hypothetical protein